MTGARPPPSKPTPAPPYPMLEPRYDMRVEQAVRVPMRDGVRLSTDLYFPDGAPEPLPVILVRTPYDKSAFRAGYLGDGDAHVRRAGVRRGRAGQAGGASSPRASIRSPSGRMSTATMRSSGSPTGRGPTARSAPTAAPTWATAQVWMAPAQPPSLAAMIPQASGSINGPADNIYRYFGTYNGGAFNLAAAAGWMVFAGSKVYLRPPSHISDEGVPADRPPVLAGPGQRRPRSTWTRIINSLPLIDMMRRANRPHTDWESILTHGLADPWWDQFPYYKGHEQINVPTLFVNSWHDFGVNETPLAVQLLPGERGIDHRARQPVRRHLARVPLRLRAHRRPHGDRRARRRRRPLRLLEAVRPLVRPMAQGRGQRSHRHAARAVLPDGQERVAGRRRVADRGHRVHAVLPDERRRGQQPERRRGAHHGSASERGRRQLHLRSRFADALPVRLLRDGGGVL